MAAVQNLVFTTMLWHYGTAAFLSRLGGQLGSEFNKNSVDVLVIINIIPTVHHLLRSTLKEVDRDLFQPARSPSPWLPRADIAAKIAYFGRIEKEPLRRISPSSFRRYGEVPNSFKEHLQRNTAIGCREDRVQLGTTTLEICFYTEP